jgi:hypothetical protein
MLRFVPAEDRMFFDELSFRKIPIRENRRRVKRSDEFGTLLPSRLSRRSMRLFAIDAVAREQELSRQDRHILRLEKSMPLLAMIRLQIEPA